MASKGFYVLVVGIVLVVVSCFMLWEPVGWLSLITLGVGMVISGAMVIAEGS